MFEKSRFALYFGNRGFFPASLQAAARKELTDVLQKAGHQVLTMPADATRHGAVETAAEGEKYARFLHENKGKYDGVILALPNFGDENGAMAAFRDCDVPIFIQAYPDDLDKMSPELRRDSFCGKFSIMDVFCQLGIRFTVLNPHVVAPNSAAFAENVDYFDRLCRVRRALKNMVVGAIGARTTAFKTVRIDELTLHRYGINTETRDLSELFQRIGKLSDADAKVKAKAERLQGYANWEKGSDPSRLKLAKMGVVLDDIIAESNMDCVAIRCWMEMQEQLGVSPCVLLSEMNERGIIAACEMDIGSAIAMRALAAASGGPAACLDWNNNYGDDEDKCILFHCGPVPASLMTGKGKVTDHAILATTMGPGKSCGCDTGRIKPMSFTYGNVLTREGRIAVYLGEGEFTNDPVPEVFFGCAGVARIDGLQDVLQAIGYMGHRHHVALAEGMHMAAAAEAMEKYLDFDVSAF